MSVINAVPLLAAAGGDYTISRSVRYRASASPYFTRPFATPTNSSKWTMSMWVKRGVLSSATTPALFGKTVSAAANFYLAFDPANTMTWTFSNTAYMTTTQVFRDPSAWYHIVAVWDSANATAAQRARLYVNGTEVTAFSVDNRSSITTSMDAWNTTSTLYMHGLGCASASVSTVTQFFDGYLTEINFIDGQALTPSSFGENDTVTGVWKPKKYAGTYGTNGFYLNFSDNSNNTAATIGKDYSGNGNNWTPNNISVTSGVTYDSMLDVPTNYADGGTGRGNYCVVNPLKKSSSATITDGNLTVAINVVGGEQPASFAVSSGKWYWEVTPNAAYSAPGILLTSRTPSASSIASDYHYYGSNGQFYTNTSGVAYGATFGNGDVIGVALDLDSNQITFYKNGTSQGAKTIVAGEYNPDLAGATTVTNYANFGQRPFAYTPPSGFKALNTQNLPEPVIKKPRQWFDVALYTTNGSTQTITTDGSGNALEITPDFLWNKGRNLVQSHYLANTVTGLGNTLNSDTTLAESATGFFTSVGAGSFGVTSETAGRTKVTWLWKKGATQGFDIVTYTGNATAGLTINHNLGVKPAMMIVKARGAATSWPMYHKALGATNWILLNSTNATTVSAQEWNNTEPTSTQFTVGNASANSNQATTYVAYLFAEVAGFSKFGSYTGNGSSDGPFVFCGFRPRFVMVKRTDSVGSWEMYDTARGTYNQVEMLLEANNSNAEYTSAPGGYSIDLLSNGFKIRGTGGSYNASGGTFVYAAFAESPFKLSLAR